jgi:hypothetical protein
MPGAPSCPLASAETSTRSSMAVRCFLETMETPEGSEKHHSTDAMLFPLVPDTTLFGLGAQVCGHGGSGLPPMHVRGPAACDPALAPRGRVDPATCATTLFFRGGVPRGPWRARCACAAACVRAHAHASTSNCCKSGRARRRWASSRARTRMATAPSSTARPPRPASRSATRTTAAAPALTSTRATAVCPLDAH